MADFLAKKSWRCTVPSILLLSRHVAIFQKGLPLVCAEAVISNLPIVTSRLSNALDLLGPAIVEAEPDDVCSYVAQIRRLASDLTFYNEKRDQCQLLARQFFDRSKSFPAALDQLILFFRPDWVKLGLTSRSSNVCFRF